MADEADPENVLAIKNVGSRVAYRPAPRRVTREFGSTETYFGMSLAAVKATETMPSRDA